MLCECGCGQTTKPAPITRAARGWVKGQPMRFVMGHRCRDAAKDYIERDCGYETPCWVWQRAFGHNGYGLAKCHGKMQNAHRFYWTRANGPIPTGMQLDHLCRNRACIRPSHLEPVSMTENVRRSASAKLTCAIVAEIRSSVLGTSQAELARMYGVTASTINDVVHHRTWKNLSKEFSHA